jgi:hypothetical protein
VRDDEPSEPVARERRGCGRHLSAAIDGRAHARARTLSVVRMSKTELRRGRELYPETDHGAPRTRGECAGAERPCPFVSCKHHLYLDVNPANGSIKLNFPDLEVWELTETCALDVADRGGIILEDVGEIMNLTRERVRQVETVAITKAREACAREGIAADALLDTTGRTASVPPEHSLSEDGGLSFGFEGLEFRTREDAA